MTHDGTVGGARHDVLTLLKYTSGRDISDLSYYGHSQSEVLFPPGTRWLVEARYDRPMGASDDVFRSTMERERPHIVDRYGASGHFGRDKHRGAIKTVLCVSQVA